MPCTMKQASLSLFEMVTKSSLRNKIVQIHPPSFNTSGRILLVSVNAVALVWHEFLQVSCGNRPGSEHLFGGFLKN